MMERRDFIRQVLMTSAAAGFAGALPRTLLAQSCPVADLPRTLVNVMLQGGADLRFLFMPAPSHWDTNYLEKAWFARRELYSSDYENYQQMFDNEYLLAIDPLGGQDFGIHNSSAWLHAEFQSGNVAVVANAFCSRNRRHDQSILNADAGEPDLAFLNFDRAGWGGRLAEQLADQPNVVELGNSVSVFSKGSTPGQRMNSVVHAEDMRDMALAGVNPDANIGSRRNILARALNAWYEARGPELQAEKSPAWAYHNVIGQRSALQAFGQAVEQRLAACQPLPEELTSLALNNAGFSQQCRNLFDACQLPDVLNQRVMSMNYGGWDTHDNELFEISANLSDLFGTAGGFATTLPLVDQLPYVDMPPRDQLVFYFASDFGRQLKVNGAAGTDHGRGTYSVMLGRAVQGGVYGEMFPQHEAMEDGNGRIPLETQGADILGLTSTEKILSAACEWVEPGTAEGVFPNAGAADIEMPGMLDHLLS